MVFPKARLLVAGLLFVGWLGFLFFLVVRSQTAVVLSRPQVLVADLVVLAKLEGEPTDRAPYSAHVEKVLYAKDPAYRAVENQKIAIVDLPFITAKQGWTGAGSYLVPLTWNKTDKDNPTYHVTVLPPVPGYYPSTATVRLRAGSPSNKTLLELLQKFTGLEPELVEASLKQLPADVRRNVPVREAEAFAEAARKAGASVDLIPAEARIYPATKSILSQFESVQLP